MYLKIGQRDVLPTKDIIGIFDMDNTTSSYITRSALSKNESEGRVVTATDDLPRSFIVCAERNNIKTKREHREKNIGTSKIFISQFSSATLAKRLENNGGDF